MCPRKILILIRIIFNIVLVLRLLGRQNFRYARLVLRGLT